MAQESPTAAADVADDEEPTAQRGRWRVKFKEESPTAVADDEALADGVPVDLTAAVADFAGRKTPDADDASDSAGHSIAGDTVDSETDGDADDTAVAALCRQQRLAPKAPVQGNPERNRSAKNNSEPEVGNFGLFFGNWGVRGTVSGRSAQRLRRETQDRQILKSPGQVVVVVEASRELEGLLRLPSVEGDPGQEGLQGRSTSEHFVIRGEEESAVLIAARKDNTTSLECLHHEVHDDHAYTEKGKPKMARSRMLVCRVGFKQNIGHLGKDIVVCGAHAHYRTMKIEWPRVWEAYWDRLARYVQAFGINFLAGDFNMSFTEVPKQLRRRGIVCDCVAWYPWQQPGGMEAAVAETSGQRLGFDSCGIFYIGGSVQASTPWSLQHIDILAAVAGDQAGLDVYHGANFPGQPWTCYRRERLPVPADRNLQDRLRDLLTPSTTTEELQRIPHRAGVWYRPYLRLKQKSMDRNEWLVDGNMHNGAHFPLCVFTNNARARSEEKAKMRSQKGKTKGAKGSGKNNRADTAVAEPTYYGKPVNTGKGTRSQSAVAAPDFFAEPHSSSSGSWQWSRSSWQ